MPKLTVLLLAALAACSTAPPIASPPPNPLPTPAPAAIAPGVYSVTLADADLPASALAEMRSGMVGAWEMAVHGPEHAVVSYNGQEVVQIPFQLQGNQITFADNDTGQYACHSTARYTWEMTAAGLRFTRIEDSCAGRVAALTARPWVKRP